MEGPCLRKRFSNVAAKEFCTAVSGFKDGLEKACGTEFGLSILFYREVKLPIQRIDFDTDLIVEHNKRLVLAEVTNPEDITVDLWDQAAYVEANFKPINPGFKPSHTWAQLQAKGTKPRQISVHIAPDEFSRPVRKVFDQGFRWWRKTLNHNNTSPL